MLIRQNYYEVKRAEIKSLTLQILQNLYDMTEYYTAYLNNPSEEHRMYMLQAEKDVDNIERKIESYILEIISLQQLEIKEIKWLFAMNRMIRDLERIGDQLTNVITISNHHDAAVLKPLIEEFFTYEQRMMRWLMEGIHHDDRKKLNDVIRHDNHVNKLNKDTYQDLVIQLEDEEKITESKLKMIIISRFLERIGDHLVNTAKSYKKILKAVDGIKD